ncbi:hypothetical protein F5Y03DRAFT_389016 [Xylaria venustula]|nr:hypothetical protein F5Y03DRAFT_389016 [Xylaria venustula]
MEPPTKKPRLADNYLDGDQFTETSRRRHDSSRASISFEGHGVDHLKATLDSLQFDQIDARQQNIKKAHFRTCAWFLNTPEYIEWTQSYHGFLWVKGKPGAGKSTLMKYLLGQLGKRKDQGILLSFFFNARGHNLEKTTMGLYRSLLLQLLEARTDLQYILGKVRLGCNWTVESLKALFEKAVEGLGDTPLVCLIDALDECEEAQIRDMISFLSGPSILPHRVRICFASRHYPHITMSTAVNIVLESQNGHSEDIVRYIKTTLNICDGGLSEQVRSDLQEKASGVFMWVVLVVDILNKEYDAGRAHMLRRRIQQLPKDLHELFRDILTRDKNNTDGLLLCIQWVLFAQKPLTPKQLYFGIISGIEPDDLACCHSDDISEECMKRYILDNSKGLAEPTRSNNPTVQFIHESVRDFLLKEDGLKRIRPDLSTNVIGQSHDILKQCCLAYINMNAVERLKPLDHEKAAESFPFLGYATQGILYHAEQAQHHNVSQHDFLLFFPRTRWVKHRNFREKKRVRQYTSEVSLLYILAETGMSALIRAHSQRQSCFEIESERYGPPILAASATKSTAAMKIMLELEAERLSDSSRAMIRPLMPLSSDMESASSRNFTFNQNETLFSQLIEHGNEEVAMVFVLTRHIGVHGIDQTLMDGSVKLVQLLINHGANISRTTLMLAAESGHTEAVKLLVNHSANMSTTNHHGNTALMLAAKNGHTETVQLLINYGADISAAVIRRRIEVVRLLLDHGADVSAIDKKGMTPLHWASEHGNCQAVKLLLNQNASLSYFGDTDVARLLLDHGADISAINIQGMTPLHCASAYGRVERAKQLLDWGANISATTRLQETPLHLAAYNGEVEMVALLLNQGADLAATTLSGETPLSTALSRGHAAAVKLLQGCGDVYISQYSHVGDTTG